MREYAYVYMTSHIHLIVTSEGEALEDRIRDFKKFTSKRIIEAIKVHPQSRRKWLLKKFSFAAKRIKRGVHFKFWKDGYHPVATRFVNRERDWINTSYCVYEEWNLEISRVRVEPLW